MEGPVVEEEEEEGEGVVVLTPVLFIVSSRNNGIPYIQ